MGFLWTLFLISLSILSLCVLLKIIYVKALKKVLSKIFNKEVQVGFGYNILSLRNIHATGDIGEFKCDKIDIVFRIGNLIKANKGKFLSFEVKNCTLNLNQLPKSTKKRDSPSFDKFIIKRVAFLISLIIVKSAKVVFRNLKLSYKDKKVSVFKFSFNLIRTTEEIITKLHFREIQISTSQPWCRIPNVQLTSRGSVNVFKELLKSQFINLSLIIPDISLSYIPGQVTLHQFAFKCHALKDDSQVQIIFQTLTALLPEFDIKTKKIRLSIRDINLNYDGFTAGQLICSRMGELIANLPNLQIERHKITATSIELAIPMTLIIDIGLIKRFIKGVSGPNKKPSSGRFRNMLIETPNADIKIILTDNHILKIPLKKATFRNMLITAKKFQILCVFPTVTYPFANAKYGELNIMRPNFALKCRKADIILSTEFSQLSYIQEVLNMFSFMSKQWKGDVSSFRDQQPPTRRAFSFTCQECHIKMTTGELTDKIACSAAAKEAAMRRLVEVQRKALQVVTARGGSGFLPGAFEEESQKILFKYYKEAAQELPPPSVELFGIDFNGLEIVWNGPAIPNKAAGVEMILKIDEHLPREEIGRVVGGALTFNFSSLSMRSRHCGELIGMEDFKLSGWFLNAKKIGKNRSDFFHYKVTCDNGLVSFLYPGISARSVNFVDFAAKIGKVHVRAVPMFSEFKQDFKLASLLFRKKKYLYRRIRTFDQFRIRFRGVFKLDIDQLRIDVHDKRCAYSASPIFEVTIPHLSIDFDRYRYNLKTGSGSVRANEGTGSRHFASIPDINGTIRVVSHNPNNPEGTRPTFIPLDSYRMADPTYMPFEKYCTHTYSLEGFLDLGDGCLSVDLDRLPALIHHYTQCEQQIDRFQKPAYYVARPHPYPTFSFVELDLILPSFFVYTQGGKITMKIGGKPIMAHVSTKNDRNITAHCSCVAVTVSRLERPLLQGTIENFAMETPNGFLIKAHSIKAQITSDLQEHFGEFEIPQRPPKKRSPMPMMTTEAELFDHFKRTQFRVETESLNLELSLINGGHVIKFGIADFLFEKRKNDTQTSLNTIAFDSLKVFTGGLAPFASVSKMKLFLASGLSAAVRLVRCEQIAVNLRPDDFDVFIPNLKSFTRETREKDEKTNIKLQRDTYLDVQLGEIRFCFLRSDNDPMMTLDVNNVLCKLSSNLDHSGSYELDVDWISVVNSTAKDGFKDMLKPSGGQQMIRARLKKARKFMKCPVIERIEIQVAPFSTAISMPFIKNLIAIFPSAEDLKVLDIDADDDDDDGESENSLPVETPAIPQDNVDHMFFCREFVFHPFSAAIDYRRKANGVFSEFLGRNFAYEGLHLFDVFGTKTQLITFVKKNIKWTVIKAVPSLIIGSKGKKKGENLPKPQEFS